MESKLTVKSEPVWSQHDEPLVVNVERELRPKLFPPIKTEEDVDDVCDQETDTELHEELSEESCDVIKSEIEIEDNSVPWTGCESISGSGTHMESSIQQPIFRNISTEEGPPLTQPTYKCELCGQCFSKKSVLDLHITRHSSEKPYKCETCDKSFSDSDLLDGHIKTHMGEKRFRCDTCGKCFFKSSDVARHMMTHTGEKPYKCNLCGKSFRQPGHLSGHLKIHSGEKPFKCTTCGKCFSNLGAIVIYKEMESELIVKSEPEWSLHDEPLTDTALHEELSGESYDVIKSEIKIEDNTVPWNSCESILSSEPCMESSIQQQLLGNNSTEEAPPVTQQNYKCELCGKCFSKKSFLVLNITTHTSEKPYRCETCSKCFSDSDLLAGHIRTHTDG